MTPPANPLQHALALSHSRLYVALTRNARGQGARAVELIDQVIAELHVQRAAIAAAHGLAPAEPAS
jgi:hypothetical protein